MVDLLGPTNVLVNWVNSTLMDERHFTRCTCFRREDLYWKLILKGLSFYSKKLFFGDLPSKDRVFKRKIFVQRLTLKRAAASRKMLFRLRFACSFILNMIKMHIFLRN